MMRPPGVVVVVVGLAVLLATSMAAAKQVPTAVATIAAPEQVTTIGCGGVAMGVAVNGREPGTRRVLGVVAAPRTYLANVGSNPAAAPFHFWTKAGIEVRAGAAVTVTVSKRWQSRVRVTWGHEEGTTLRFARCSLGAKWNPYPGGFLSRTAAVCVPLIFATGHRSATLLFGVGRHC